MTRLCCQFCGVRFVKTQRKISMRFRPKDVTASVLIMLSLAGCQKNTGTAQTQTQIPQTQSVSPPAKPLTYEGPFGLKMGLSIEVTKALISGLSKVEQSDWIFRTDRVPIPHPDFDSYLLNFSQKYGLCSISAFGKDIKSGDSGFEIKSAFNSLDESISKKYGIGKKYDYATSKYDSPEYWMMYLLKKNRTLAKFWDKDSGSNLLNNLSAISLEAKASNMSTGYLIMTYEFENMVDCIAESKAEKNKGL